MTPEEVFNQEVWSLMQEIKTQILRGPDGSDIEFCLPEVGPKWSNQLNIINKLTERDILDNDWVFEKDLATVKKVILSIHHPEFDQLYDQLKYEFSPKVQIIEREIIREVIEQKKGEKNKFPHRLPAGTKWENLIIKFLDNENIFIKAKQFEHSANYEDMGFCGAGKDPQPSKQWVLLRVLSKVGGELTIQDKEANEKIKKQKEILTKILQNYFSIDYDPFYPYRSSPEKRGNSYKIKLTLIPPEAMENEVVEENKDDPFGLKEFLDEEAPQVYENH